MTNPQTNLIRLSERCPVCSGDGAVVQAWDMLADGSVIERTVALCGFCNGRKVVFVERQTKGAK